MMAFIDQEANEKAEEIDAKVIRLLIVIKCSLLRSRKKCVSGVLHKRRYHYMNF
jgi:hypothetical protein